MRICDEADEDLRRGASPRQMGAHTARFHRLVLESARNHILLEFGEQLSLRSRWFFAPLVSTIAPQAWIEHREVAGLIAVGDAEAAALAMHVHITMSRDAYLATRGADGSDLVRPPAPRSPATAPPARRHPLSPFAPHPDVRPRTSDEETHEPRIR